MVTFCDILHEAKQKNKNKLSRVRSTDWKSALKSSIIYYCLVSLYLQMQLDAIKLIELNKLTWKLSSAFHPVCSTM